MNREIDARRGLLAISARDDLEVLLREFHYDWNNNVAEPSSELFQIFEAEGWTEGDRALSRGGRLVFGRLALHFQEFKAGTVVGSYVIERRLRSGKNSVIFRATHRLLGTPVALKFIRPGASDDIAASLIHVSGLNVGETVVMPTDVIEASARDVVGGETTVTCLVFPMVTGMSFRDFLGTPANHLNSNVVVSFIRQIGRALETLEASGAYHGDLHAENIIVINKPNQPLTFRLLDISYGAVGSMSLEASRNSDLELFKQHIWSILTAQKQRIPNVSLRRFIGTRYFRHINEILSDKVRSISELMSIFEDDLDYQRYLDEKQRFVGEKFTPPASFRLQRYEEFIDPSIASQLFVPFAELQQKINEFSNVYVSGNRGSGKSTYLASLAFFPTVERPTQDFKQTFGIYFPCRQGELRAISPALDLVGLPRVVAVLHIVVLKVIRRTLEILVEAMARRKIVALPDYAPIREFLDRFLPTPGLITVGSDILPEMENFASTMLRVELDQLRMINNGMTLDGRHATPSDVIAFFELLRANVPELAGTRFHILFDDAGEPYVDREIQRAINELIITSNALYCVKLTAEKNTYVFESSRGKLLENGHDYYEQDISYTLFLGPRTSGLRHSMLEEYFRRIVGLRLKYFGYASEDIRDYLGATPDSSLDTLTYRLGMGRRDANYYGWTTVWHIADRTPRNLLELVSEIFAAGDVEQNTVPHEVPIRDQNRAVRTISDKRLQSISQIPGAIQINGRNVSLGNKLFDVTLAIGSTFHSYLQQDARRLQHGDRLRQHLAIERNELVELRPDADAVLQKLVTFGILDSSRIVYSRDDSTKKPIYVLNRILCPAFGIGLRRDDHLRLSKSKLEQLLLFPHDFRKNGTKRLRQENHAELELFGYNLGGTDDA
ncbi:protein kinase [Rhizobium leguminosarum]|uniref:ORC-CDC6 family AAA ATPase n=1 Tax=Rhizobium leguminosarum TaxID=384 RepID=UPI001C9031DA|nr:protein kinase [Rhizobium leguminosarum]MBY2937191.1 protein kinase [Rhizobium leguminosarum]